MELDLDQLVEHVGLGKEDVLELIEMLLAQSDSQLETIRAGTSADGDIATARRAAHSLKGMAGMLGLDELADAARVIEKAARADERDAAAAAIPDLEARVTETKAAFAALGESGGGGDAS